MPTLGSSSYNDSNTVNAKSQMDSKTIGGRTMKKSKRSHFLKTHRHGRGAFLKNWSKQQPTRRERTNMMKRCGKKCFLGPKKSFPICTRNTCKINRKGVYAAYMRANEYKTIKGSQKYYRISRKARKMLNRLY
jgi:hypothetical protein